MGFPAPAGAVDPLPEPPKTWTLTGSSFYRQLYDSTTSVPSIQRFPLQDVQEILPVDKDHNGTLSPEERAETNWVSDRVVTAVAADLVTQFFKVGTNPVVTRGDDLIAFRSNDLVPILPENLDLGADPTPASKKFLFSDVQQWVRDAALTTPEETCRVYPWWLPAKPPPEREEREPAFPDGRQTTYPECFGLVHEVREAMQHERELLALREDLILIAYGAEAVFDGQTSATGAELRTYDLLLDLAAVSNLFGNASFQPLFAEGNEGEQCDDPKLCPSCLLPAANLCGDGGVQGAEQCDDGNRVSGDGCDAFCQVEGAFCGNGIFGEKAREWWEACDEGKECPSGAPCSRFSDCLISGSACPADDPASCGGVWKKICRFDGATCDAPNQGDAFCNCPPGITGFDCTRWKKDSCRYAADGVCRIGGMTTDVRCTSEVNCLGLSTCQKLPGKLNGFCTNHPLLGCKMDDDCTSCTTEEIWGTCYDSGKRCNGNEDCPGSGYCMLETGDVCRPRMIGAKSGDNRSICNERCEDVPRCGDRIVYLSTGGGTEECDDGMQCEDGSQCAYGQKCPDGSECKPRNASRPQLQSCDAQCILQICGDTVEQGGEECDTGATCIDGTTSCNLLYPTACLNHGLCTYPKPNGDPQPCVIGGTACPAPPASAGPGATNACNRNETCAARSTDAGSCDALCQDQMCGDGAVQKKLGEDCDDGGRCENGSHCTDAEDCPMDHSYCEGAPQNRCDSHLDCPRGKACLPPNGSIACVPKSDDGCSATCKAERCGDAVEQSGEECDAGSKCSGGANNGAPCSNNPGFCSPDGLCLAQCSAGCSNQCKLIDCGNGILDGGGPDCNLATPGGNEECDDGNTDSLDGCSSTCKVERCGDGTVDTDGKDNVAGNADDEECEPDVIVSKCVAGPDNGNACVSNTDCRSPGICKTCPTNGCSPTCKLPKTGDCALGCWEQCDDGVGGGGQPQDSCKDGVLEYCGDGMENNGGEECDANPPPDYDSITPTCCGDGSCCSSDAGAAGTCVSTCKGSCVTPAGTCMMPGCRKATGCPAASPSCPAGDTCGDGCRDSDEECDGGKFCTSSCKLRRCGDGTVDAVLIEECDPGMHCSGGANDGNGCTTPGDCPGGTCSVTSTNVCNSACQKIDCGDCRADAPKETCDDGGPPVSNDGCSASCQREYCGDKTTQGPLGEECDDGGLCSDNVTSCKTQALRPPDACPKAPYVCSPGGGECVTSDDAIGAAPECGASGSCTQIQTACVAEPCDSCSNSCTVVQCGNGIRECKEECDDTNTNDGDGCSASCKLEFCGDRVPDEDGRDNQPGMATADDDGFGGKDDAGEKFFPGTDDEECDNGMFNNDTEQGTCRTNCRRAGCGDGVVDPLGKDGVSGNDDDEQCDQPTCPDGRPCVSHAECGISWCRSRSGDGGCNEECKFEGCGDGDTQTAFGETCDDGGFCARTTTACAIDTAEADCGAGVPCIPVSGDGCSSTCEMEFLSCGNGTFEPEGGDGVAGTADDEECDPGDLGTGGICPELDACSCPDGGTSCSPQQASCDLGTCNLTTRLCTKGGQICSRDENCRIACAQTCTATCKHAARTCGNGIRETGEQCDDGKTCENGSPCKSDGSCPDGSLCSVRNGDGCSFLCEVERLDLCGNGRIDYLHEIFPTKAKVPIEECDQGHPYRTMECTPYCRWAGDAPMCGDGRKDPSGENRRDLLQTLLAQSEGFRLDWRMPDGKTLGAPESVSSIPVENQAGAILRGGGGWYTVPRAFNRSPETPFEKTVSPSLDPANIADPIAQRTCSLCGNGRMDPGELCDSGRLSGGSYPVQRANMREWHRMAYAAGFMRYAAPYYWLWYTNLFPFGFHPFSVLTSLWYLSLWNQSHYVNFIRTAYGGWHWYYADAAWKTIKEVEERTFAQENCSAQCALQLCGNDRIDPGETCEDDNRSVYGRVVGNDGCSRSCFLEKGFDFQTKICGDDVLSTTEECDDGGVCVYKVPKCDATGACVLVDHDTQEYCRFDNVRPSRSFCPGLDEKAGTADDGQCRVVGGDGCSATCAIEPLSVCGNGILEPYEECDNGGECDDGNAATEDKDCFSNKDCTGSIACKTQSGDGCSGAGSPIGECKFDPPLCGNKLREPWGGEDCDDGNTTGGDGCSALCKLEAATCGNGAPESPEQCDDGAGNGAKPNDCRTNCVFPHCGDKVLDRNEECDDGNATPRDGCTFCFVELCGNGRLDAGETCDEGGMCQGGGAACTHDTAKAVCGADVPCVVSDTDDPNTDGKRCSQWCTELLVCGNARLDPGEQCDDGNAWGGDGCSGSGKLLSIAGKTLPPCSFEYCGDGVVQSGLGEECDDANLNDTDGCRNACRLPACGDGKVDATAILFAGIPTPYKEQCDPGRHCSHDSSVSCKDDQECPIGPCILPLFGGNGRCAGDPSRHCSSDRQCLLGSCQVLQTSKCAANCTIPAACGNRIVEPGEECDPPGAGCTPECQLEAAVRCGNGKIESAEQCDDGNRADHDGCTETCQLEEMACSGDVCSIPSERFTCSDNASCLPQKGCEVGACTLKRECAGSCVFGRCGNTTIDAGEQCDDGRHCSHNPKISCTTHAGCTAGTCNGANATLGIAGYCTGDDLGPCDLTKNECTNNRSQRCSRNEDCHLRACMTNVDCQSLCLPTSGDGCSSSCMQELPKATDDAALTFCQEEVMGISGQVGSIGTRIGSGQVLAWKRTLLTPDRNPFLSPTDLHVRFLGARGGPWWAYQWKWWEPNALQTFSQNAWPWSWGSSFWSPEWWSGFSGWWGGWQGYYGGWFSGCAPGRFPNSIGNVIHAIAGCLDTVARQKTTPDRAAIMPYEPVGVTSGFACREPRAQLTGITELPPLPTIALPPYDPRALLSDLERAICAASGFPERSFLFLCSDPEMLAPPLRSSFDVAPLMGEREESDAVRELLMSHMLSAAYRASDRTLDQYFREAFSGLTTMIERASQLIRDLERIQFATDACPIDGTPLCSPPSSP